MQPRRGLAAGGRCAHSAGRGRRPRSAQRTVRSLGARPAAPAWPRWPARRADKSATPRPAAHPRTRGGEARSREPRRVRGWAGARAAQGVARSAGARPAGPPGLVPRSREPHRGRGRRCTRAPAPGAGTCRTGSLRAHGWAGAQAAQAQCAAAQEAAPLAWGARSGPQSLTAGGTPVAPASVPGPGGSGGAGLAAWGRRTHTTGLGPGSGGGGTGRGSPLSWSARPACRSAGGTSGSLAPGTH